MMVLRLKIKCLRVNEDIKKIKNKQIVKFNLAVKQRSNLFTLRLLNFNLTVRLTFECTH